MFNRYPYTNFHELNLDYFIQHFNEIFTEWEQLYNTLQSWKTETTEELDQWRADVEEDLDEREAALRAELEIWKQDTADDISEWETATFNALDAWKTAATAQFEAIRVQAAASAEAAAASQAAAASSAAAALLSATEAEEAAAAIQASAAQITENADNIAALQSAFSMLFSNEATLTSNFLDDSYIDDNKEIGTIINIEPSTSVSYKCIVVPCKKTDKFSIYGKGGTTPRLWAFTDNNYALLSRATGTPIYTEQNPLILTADEDGYFIANVTASTAYGLTHYYNRVPTDITLSESGVPADSNAVGNALSTLTAEINTKADTSTVNDIIGILNKKIKYVSTSGNDNNNGNSRDTAYATLSKALTETADVIYMDAGTYIEPNYGEFSNYRYKTLTIIGNGAVIKAAVNGIQFRYVNVDINGLTIDLSDASGANTYGMLLLNCTGKLSNCIVHDATDAGGFRIDGSKLLIDSCIAYNCAIDGFNGHGNTSETEATFLNCIAHDNGDDGASIHENGIMNIIGGEYYENGSTGIAYAQRCSGQVHGAHIHNNGAGIECYGTSNAQISKVDITGCIILNNNKVAAGHATEDIGYGIHTKYYDVYALGNCVEGHDNGPYKQGGGSTLTVLTATPAQQ